MCAGDAGKNEAKGVLRAEMLSIHHTRVQASTSDENNDGKSAFLARDITVDYSHLVLGNE